MKTEKKPATAVQLKEIMMASLFVFKKALENAKAGICDEKFLEQMGQQFSDLKDFLYDLERVAYKPYLKKSVNDSLAIIVTKTWELDRYSGNSLHLTLSEKESKKLFSWSRDGHHEELDMGDGVSISVNSGIVRIYFHGDDNDDGIHSVDKSMASDDLCAAFVKKHKINLNVAGIMGPYKHAEKMLDKFGIPH